MAASDNATSMRRYPCNQPIFRAGFQSRLVTVVLTAYRLSTSNHDINPYEIRHEFSANSDREISS
jgi:hypothetical protein